MKVKLKLLLERLMNNFCSKDNDNVVSKNCNDCIYFKSVDLVDFDDIKLFMYKNDNIYSNFVDNRRKNYPLRQFLKYVKENGYPRPSINKYTIDKISSCKDMIFLIMKHLWSIGEEFTVLDVGCHVGLFGLKLASVIREMGKDNKVICFDIGETSELMTYNIKLNGLENWVIFENLAISDISGPVIVYARHGHTESNNILDNTEDSYSYIADGVSLSDYIYNNSIKGPVLLKIDTEGLDLDIINNIRNIIDSEILILIFEYNQPHIDKSKAIEILKFLFSRYYLFDIYNVLNPRMVKKIDKYRLDEFFREVSNYPFKWTDILCLPRKLKNIDAILNKLYLLKSTELTRLL